MIYLPAEFIDQVVDEACAIQAIPAPTFNEEQRATFFQQQFHALGLEDIQRDLVGNVLGKLPGSGKHSKKMGKPRPLVVSAHMDTVHPMGTPLGVRIMENRVIGPGIGDNALGLAALLGLVRYLKENEISLPGDLWLAANVGEEGLGDLRGIQAIVDQFKGEPLAYIVIEGMGLGTILHRGLGVERYRISMETPGGHSWVDYGQPSAIHELCQLVTRLTTITLPTQPCTTMNVGVIHGGTSVNTIASHAWLELDLRSEGKEALANVVSEVQRVVRAAQQGSVQVKMERIGRRLAGELPKQHPLVILASNVLKDMGFDVRLEIASTDANLPLSRGYPSICVGLTHGNNAHTNEEYILISPVSRGLAQLFAIVTQAWEALA